MARYSIRARSRSLLFTSVDIHIVQYGCVLLRRQNPSSLDPSRVDVNPSRDRPGDDVHNNCRADETHSNPE